MKKVLSVVGAEFQAAFDKGMEFIIEASKVLDAKKQNSITLAFEEVFVNILTYNKEQENLVVDIEINTCEDSFDVKISDNGIRFNPLSKKAPDINASIEDREPGGLGIFLLKNITDYVLYGYEEKCNVLRFGVKLVGKN